MSINNFGENVYTTVVALEPSQVEQNANIEAVKKLITKIKEGDDQVRTNVFDFIDFEPSLAIKPLAKVMAEEGLEVARTAKHTLWKIVRHAGRSGASMERKAFIIELISVLETVSSVPVKREVLWMLSEIGSDESVEPITCWLVNQELREDARMALQRIPGRNSLTALKKALKTVPDDFKLNIAQSLRKRGVEVAGRACVKMVPTKSTTVKPLE